MKIGNVNILLCLLAIVGLSACDKQEPDFFSEKNNGIYFDYETAAELTTKINFADRILGNPESLPVEVKTKLLGHISQDARKAVLKTRPVEGYPEAQVILPEVEFKDGEYQKYVSIQVVRPAERETEYAICLYFDTTEPGALGAGIAGRGEFTIFVQETYTRPTGWDEKDWAVSYLGNWTPDKHIFFVNLLQDNNYAANGALYDWNKLISYNTQAVEALRRMQQENPDTEITIDIPFSTDCNYSKPYYWASEHEKYLGDYSASTFALLAAAVGANTSNEVELLGSEERLADLNRIAVLTMMRNYNMYYSSWTLSTSQFSKNCWFPMFPNIEYEVVQPDCWTDWGIGGGQKPTKYYGEYSDEKYRFMISAWLEHCIATDKEFMLWQLFPLVIDWGVFDSVWDDAAGGEETIKECYKVIKAAYDAAPSGTYSFTFPELVF